VSLARYPLDRSFAHNGSFFARENFTEPLNPTDTWWHKALVEIRQQRKQTCSNTHRPRNVTLSICLEDSLATISNTNTGGPCCRREIGTL